jgi:hypothetical protein
LILYSGEFFERIRKIGRTRYAEKTLSLERIGNHLDCGSSESVAHHTFIVVGIGAHDRCTTRGTGA